MAGPTSAFHLRELPASFWRVLGFWFSQVVLLTIGGLVLLGLSIPYCLLVAGAAAETGGGGLLFLLILLVPYVCALALSIAAPWIVIRSRFRFGGARLAFVRESLIDKAGARRAAEEGA